MASSYAIYLRADDDLRLRDWVVVEIVLRHLNATTAPCLHSLLRIPLQAIASPVSRLFNDNVFYQLINLNIDVEISNNLTSRIVNFTVATAHRIGMMTGFWVNALLDITTAVHESVGSQSHQQRSYQSSFDAGAMRGREINAGGYQLPTYDEMVSRLSTPVEFNGGFVREGSSREAIQRLKKEIFNASSASETKEEPSCAICWEEFGHETELTRMPCSHAFHGACIVQWLNKKKTCPTCRFVLED